MKSIKIALLSCLSMLTIACSDDDDNALPLRGERLHSLTAEMKIVRDYVPDNAIIAHRGTSYWAPESTESAYRWARNIGADYLEADLQMTKDGVILVMHDNVMTRTTNIKDIYPNRAKDPTSTFTYEELLKLDAGSWFNKDNPDRARSSFKNQHQYISTLEDLIMYAEGKRLKRNAQGERIWSKNSDGSYNFEYEQDPNDNGNRPGIYVETKEPALNPGIEQALEKELNRLGWNINTQPATETAQFKNGKINVGNTNGKVVLQTFSHKSLLILKSIFNGKIPTALLFWKGTGPDDIHNDETSTYIQHINFGLDNLAQFIGPSIAGGTPPDNWPELLNSWQADLIHKSGMKIHPYSFDNKDQMEKYFNYSDGMFTNQSDMTILFYHSKGLRNGGPAYQDAKTVLTTLGY